MRFNKFCTKTRASAVLWLLVINFFVCDAGVSKNHCEIVKCSKIDVNNYEIHCDSSTVTTAKSISSCFGKKIDCSSDNISSNVSHNTKSTCTIYCDSVSSCDNSIIIGSGCYHTIIIAQTTDTPTIINMTLHNIHSTKITIKTSSFINSTIIIHPNTNELEIDSKIFANNNVISLEAQKTTMIRTNASDNNKHEDMYSNTQNQTIATMSTNEQTQAR